MLAAKLFFFFRMLDVQELLTIAVVLLLSAKVFLVADKPESCYVPLTSIIADELLAFCL